MLLSLLLCAVAPSSPPQSAPVAIAPPDVSEDSAFGGHFDLDGNTSIFVAPYDDAVPPFVGSVHIYEDAGSGWARTFLHRSAGEFIGFAAAVDGDVAAYRRSFPEAVVVLERQAGVWSQTAALPYPGDPVGSSGFGFDIAIAGDRIAVGAPTGSEGGMLTGAAYVFERAGAAWVLTETFAGTPNPGSFSTSPNFGRRVELVGDVLVVSAPRTNQGSIYAAGALYIFEFGPGGWVPTAALGNPPAAVGSDLGGRGMSLDGDLLAVAAVGYTEGAFTSAGIVHTYERTGSGWLYGTSVHDPRPSQYGAFGLDLALDGDRLAVGRSSYHVRELSSYPLAVETFTLQPSGGWQHDGTLLDPHAGPDTGFGLGVRFDGATLMVAAPSGYEGGERRGKVYAADAASGWLPVTTDVCSGTVCSCPSAEGWAGCGNSTEQDGALTGSGSMSLALDDLELFAYGLPANAAATLVLAPTLSMPVLQGGGNLCVQGGLQLAPQSTTPAGTLNVPTGLVARAAAAGVTILPGDTWYFQVVYDDPVRVFRCLTRSPLSGSFGVPLWNGRPVLVAGAFNLTNAVGVTFVP